MRAGSRVSKWTLQEDEQLRSMIVAGRPPAEIAVKLRRSVAAVYARATAFVYHSSGFSRDHVDCPLSAASWPRPVMELEESMLFGCWSRLRKGVGFSD